MGRKRLRSFLLWLAGLALCASVGLLAGWLYGEITASTFKHHSNDRHISQSHSNHNVFALVGTMLKYYLFQI